MKTESRYPLFDQPPTPPVPLLDPSLPEAEKPRLSAQHHLFAARLRKGPATNVELSAISQRFGARLHELKRAGFLWEKQCTEPGVYEYRMIRDFLETTQ